MTSKIPDRGDIVWIDFSPTVGHEQSGRRPALVLTPARYNDLTDLMLICPVTSRVKQYIFEIPLPPGLPVRGVVLSDQVRCVDWRSRRIEFIAALPLETLAAVQRNVVKLVTQDLGR